MKSNSDFCSWQISLHSKLPKVLDDTIETHTSWSYFGSRNWISTLGICQCTLSWAVVSSRRVFLSDNSWSIRKDVKQYSKLFKIRGWISVCIMFVTVSYYYHYSLYGIIKCIIHGINIIQIWSKRALLQSSKPGWFFKLNNYHLGLLLLELQKIKPKISVPFSLTVDSKSTLSFSDGLGYQSLETHQDQLLSLHVWWNTWVGEDTRGDCQPSRSPLPAPSQSCQHWSSAPPKKSSTLFALFARSTAFYLRRFLPNEFPKVSFFEPNIYRDPERWRELGKSHKLSWKLRLRQIAVPQHQFIGFAKWQSHVYTL